MEIQTYKHPFNRIKKNKADLPSTHLRTGWQVSTGCMQQSYPCGKLDWVHGVHMSNFWEIVASSLKGVWVSWSVHGLVPPPHANVDICCLFCTLTLFLCPLCASGCSLFSFWNDFIHCKYLWLEECFLVKTDYLFNKSGNCSYKHVYMGSGNKHNAYTNPLEECFLYSSSKIVKHQDA